MSNELPGEWGKRLGPRGLHSYRDVESSTGVSKATVHRLMTGGRTSPKTVNAIADALFDGDRDLVWRLHGESFEDFGDWSLPAKASLLNEDQRQAILNLIDVMVPPVAIRGDVSKPPKMPKIPRVPKPGRMSVNPGKTEPAIAADDQEQSIAAEQESLQEP